MRAVSLVALSALTRDPTGLPLWLLLREIVTEEVVVPQPTKFASAALLVREDVPPERWEAIVKLIRKKYRHYEFELFEKKGVRGWGKIR